MLQILRRMNKTREEMLLEALNLLESSPHFWTPDACPTCEQVSKLVGRDFGCRILHRIREANQLKLKGMEEP